MHVQCLYAFPISDIFKSQATLEMAMLSFQKGPPSVIGAVKMNHELVNTPCVGTEGNFAFTANQLNLAHIREWNSSKY